MGAVPSGHWHKAFAETPRHAFVPEYFLSRGGVPTRWQKLTVEHGHAWLWPIYDNNTLVTRLQPIREAGDGFFTGVPTSSSTQPSLTARMLEAAELTPTDEVLDAGTGTGYQAALLLHRLHDSAQLVSADIDPDLTDSARRALASLGHTPEVVTTDIRTHDWGRTFAKVIVTCALPEVTETLRAAVAPGGRLIVNLFPPMSGGLAVLDAKEDGSLEGRFHADGGSYMAARGKTPQADPPVAEVSAEGRPTDVPVDAFDDYHFTFLLAVHLPGAQLQYGTDDDSPSTVMRRLVMPDGDWAESVYVPGAGPYVREGGDTGVWDTVERWWSWYLAQDRPPWDRFGLTVTYEGHTLWLDSPENKQLWRLPV
ncbi:methyltransferase domain-containing protein [Streptomyces acidiscabies]|uniref:Protein-L-isoaspartate O-methyltransferase n=1 Tax=Streptomyces acidiscabies TaxID=42234 RepID=A0AAP6EK75_9ACTN|nr:methyltransferase domain-containing protein [Streptomyces acidiscabies]MBP5938170.1 methyltransferase domain-containing protein [Streptomyces sp. LBUM 1476]MBZ3909184.1 methyltransferase domain-containing protein [Streptomyces acidiscabies]MDX2965764.1 methyltransferase domain-containing protein [Streptomyces acidiscabies]MDX3016409.1 methyltransferase domain-containing protein [Streptomyces acidiscabies]MDX3788685.1 methyltransferase domain-containing protein [Streptomyces acidiscabies]